MARFTQDFTFLTFINPAANNFVSQTSLLRETNRTPSIMAFQSATTTASRAKRSVPSKSIHPTNFTSFDSTKCRHTSQGNSVNVERNSITIKAKFFPLRNQATLLKVAGIVGLQPKQEHKFCPTRSMPRRSLELKANPCKPRCDFLQCDLFTWGK